MRKLLYIYIVFAWFLGACNYSSHLDTVEAYTCAMHPQILKYAPGACPICQMPLVLKIKNDTLHSVGNKLFESNTDNEILSNLPIDTLQKASFTSHIEVLGRVVLDPKFSGSIVANTEGRIEKLYVKSKYDYVKKGQRVMDIYSPEILTAQQNLLFLLKKDPSNTVLIEASKQKLEALGMSNIQIQQLVRNGKPFYTVWVYSAYSGYVKSVEMGTEAVNAMEAERPFLNLSEGMYVKKGQSLFGVYQQGKTWAWLDVYNNDMAWIKKGLDVEITAEILPEALIPAKVNFVEPWYENNSKTMKIRAEFDNSKWQLPIGAALKARIYFKTSVLQWLPKSALVSLGYEHVVFVKNKQGFVPRKVQVGIDYKDMIAIVSGLQLGEKVASVGQYLLDNEQFVEGGVGLPE